MSVKNNYKENKRYFSFLSPKAPKVHWLFVKLPSTSPDCKTYQWWAPSSLTTPPWLSGCVLNGNRKGNCSSSSHELHSRSQIIGKNLREGCQLILVYVDQASSPLGLLPRLAGVPSLTFSAVAIQSLKDKGRGVGVDGKGSINLLSVEKCIPLSCNLAPYFSSSHSSFSAIIHPPCFPGLTVDFKACMQLSVNKQPQRCTGFFILKCLFCTAVIKIC